MAKTALSQAIDLVGPIREIAVQMATSTQSAETRAMAAGEVDWFIDQAIVLANS